MTNRVLIKGVEAVALGALEGGDASVILDILSPLRMKFLR
jgi:hypothetical protein